MPIYEHQCGKCGAVFETMRPIVEADAPMICPRCGGVAWRVVSVFASGSPEGLRVPEADALRAAALQRHWEEMQGAAEVSAEVANSQPVLDEVSQLRSSVERLAPALQEVLETVRRSTPRDDEMKDLRDSLRTLQQEQKRATALLQQLEGKVHSSPPASDLAGEQVAEALAKQSASLTDLTIAVHGVKERPADAPNRAAEIESVADALARHSAAVTDLTIAVHGAKERPAEVPSRAPEIEAVADALARHSASVTDLAIAMHGTKEQAAEAKRLLESARQLQEEQQQALETINRTMGGLNATALRLNSVPETMNRLTEHDAEMRRLLDAAVLLQAEQQRALGRLSEISVDAPAKLQEAIKEATASLNTKLTGASAEMGALAKSLGEIAVKSQQLDAVAEALKEAGPAAADLSAATQQIKSYEAEMRRLREASAALHSDQQVAINALTDLAARVRRQIQDAADSASASIKESAQFTRTELDMLLKKVLDIGGKAAQIDADIRSKEWLSRLLLLIERRDGIKPSEIRVLSLIVLEAVEEWKQQHTDALPSTLQSDLTRLRSQFREWKP